MRKSIIPTKCALCRVALPQVTAGYRLYCSRRCFLAAYPRSLGLVPPLPKALNLKEFLRNAGWKVDGPVGTSRSGISVVEGKRANLHPWPKSPKAAPLLAEWNDPRHPEQVARVEKAEFKCSLGHEWSARIFSRFPTPSRPKGKGCPFCAKTGPAKSQSLWTCWTKNPKAPTILTLWADQRQPQDVASRDTTALWRCDQGHAYQRAPWAQLDKKKKHCPVCKGYASGGRLVSIMNSTCRRGHPWSESRGVTKSTAGKTQNYCRTCANENKRKRYHERQEKKPITEQATLRVSARSLAVELMSFFEKEHIDADQD